MLRPATLAAQDYAMAKRPTLGYEQQLWVSLGQAHELGTLTVTAKDTATYVANVAENLALAAEASELMMVLDIDLDNGTG